MTNEIPEAPLVGVVMGSKSDWETMRHACEVLDRAGHPPRVEGGLGAPDAGSAVPLRPRGRGSRPGGVDRRGGRGGAPAGHAGGDLASCRCWACRSRARCCAGSTRCCRSCRCPGACRSAPWPSARPGAANAATPGRRDPGAEVSRDPRGPGPFPPGPDRLRGRIAGMSHASRIMLHSSEATSPVPAGLARRDRQRPTGPDVHPGGAADGLSRRGAQRQPRTCRPHRWPTGRSSAARPLAVAAGVRRAGPRRSPSSSRTSRPRRCAGCRAGGRCAPAGGRSGSAQNRLREKTLPGPS